VKHIGDRKSLLKANRWVVKVGTGVLSNSEGLLDSRQIGHLASQVADFHLRGKQVILVSSGAVAAGMARLNLKHRPQRVADLQACAAIGQNLLMTRYDHAFSRCKMTVAQILLTYEDFNHAERRQNVLQTMLNLLHRKVVPIINENDAISFAEINALLRFGDNDKLASMVHEFIDADVCVILSSVDGFLIQDEENPKRLKVLSTISHISTKIVRAAGDSKSARSVGGMKTKIEAAKRVLKTGKPFIIANGKTPKILIRLSQGETLGTLFKP
jgi:glutamate 5-kinase